MHLFISRVVRVSVLGISLWTCLLTSLFTSLWMNSASAQESVVPPQNKLITEPVNQFLQIETKNNNLIELLTHSKKELLKVRLNLKENTCTQAQNATCFIHLPYDSSMIAMRWARHPSKQGQLVYRKNGTDEDGKEQLAISSFGGAEFDLLRKENPPEVGAWLECSSKDWIPWTPSNGSKKTDQPILFWDEDFEKTNTEIKLGSSGESVNKFTQRVTGLKLRDSGDKIDIVSRDIKFGAFIDFLSIPLIAYRLQLTFASQNLTEELDEQCVTTFDVDFGKVFETFIDLIQPRTEDKVQVSEFVPLKKDDPVIQRIPVFFRPEATIYHNFHE